MQASTPHNDKPSKTSKLRTGWTTGACATAAAKAAYLSLITGREIAKVSITLPRGQEVEFNIDSLTRINDNSAMATVIKDAGDDPDVTHGASISTRVVITEQPGIVYRAGKGVGTVTRPGLKLAVGEPAINPVPRQMLANVIEELAHCYDQPGHVEITVSIENGEELAKRTLNSRLGIVGGLSILGTTGIVKPYSCSAWIDSIHRGIDVAKACNIEHVAACTGSTSEQTVQQHLKLADVAMLEMGDFVGALLKYLRKNPIPRLTVGGGFAKICKIAMGHVNLHSRESVVDFDWLAGQALTLGVSRQICSTIKNANTALEVLSLSQQHSFDLPGLIALLAQKKISERLGETIAVSVMIVNAEGRVVGQAIA